MRKTILSIIVLVAIVLNMVPISVLSANDPLVQYDVNICLNGSTYSSKVYVDGENTVFAPVMWLQHYGLLEKKEASDHMEFFDPEFRFNVRFAKRIFVYSDGRYEIKFFEGFQKGFYTYYKGEFSKMVELEGQQWVPVNEILPLMDAHVDIWDGCIQIRTITTPMWKAIARWQEEMSGIVFQADVELFGESITTPGYYLVSTIVDKRLDRMFSIDNRGDINDYETLFKAYLGDNETYLSCFDGQNDLFRDNVEFIKSTLGDLEVAWNLSSGLYSGYDELGQAIGFLNSAGLSESKDRFIAGDVIEAVNKIYNFIYLYNNQVDDHRNMLRVMYNQFVNYAPNDATRQERWSAPSKKAADNVVDLYSGKVDALKVFTKKALVEAKEKAITEVATSLAGAMKPALIAFDVTVTIMKTFGDYAEIENGALTSKADRICKTAYACYKDCFESNAVTKGDFNRLRLLALMTLVSSKHAYETYAPWETEQIERIQEMLVDFYQAAESFAIYDTNYIKDTQASLKQKTSNLNINCDTDFDTAIQDGDIFVFLVNYLVEQHMMGDGTGTVTEFDFCGTAFQDERLAPAYYKEEITAEDYIWGDHYIRYYKLSDVNAWCLKYYGKTFDKTELSGWWKFGTYEVVGDDLAVSYDGGYGMPGWKLTVNTDYISYAKAGRVYHQVECTFSSEMEGEFEYIVTYVKTKYGYALSSIKNTKAPDWVFVD